MAGPEPPLTAGPMRTGQPGNSLTRREAGPAAGLSEGAGTVGEREEWSPVFRAFAREEFLEWPAWERLRTILRATGGSYGLSGPRGSGKSWLMLRAIDEVRNPTRTGDTAGIGLWYPSPSEYDPLAFLASLSDSLCNEIDRRFRRSNPLREAIASNILIAYVLLVVRVGAILAAVALSLQLSPFTLATIMSGTVAGALLILFVVRMLSVVSRSQRREAQLLSEATLIRERARFSSKQRDLSEFGAYAGKGLVARFKASRERELTERPTTLSALVNDFRALAAQAGEVTGRVVIAIDELDKMAEPDKVRSLLRDIKAIFEVPRVHFLVSVSDEASRSLNLGALTGRNEFNSSFYTVIELPPAAPDACADLLERRGDARADLLERRGDARQDVSAVLGVLAGGNPREVLRLAELVGPRTTGAAAAIAVLKEEALNLRREIVTAEQGEREQRVLGPQARTESFKSLPDVAFERRPAFLNLAQASLDPQMWNPEWKDEGWEQLFGEPWRRLMIRLNVAGTLVTSLAEPEARLDEEIGLLLRDVIIAASQSLGGRSRGISRANYVLRPAPRRR
jgi:hypothetical protein